MLQYEYSQRSNALSWDVVGQNIVDSVAQLPTIDIVILYIDCNNSDFEQYYFGIKNLDSTVIDKELFKLTVLDFAGLHNNDNLIVRNYDKSLSSFKSISYIACLEAKICSSIYISLFSQSNLTASLSIHRLQKFDDWQQQEIEAVNIMASQAKILVSQMLASRKLKELVKRETTVNRITATIRSSLEPPVMFATIVKELGSALKVDGCTLSLWTKSDRFVKCVGLYNPHEPEQIVRDSPNWQQATTSNVPIAENPVLQALLYTRKPVCSADLEKQRNMARYELPLHSKARALLIVPLIVEAEIIGSITLRQNEASRNWSQAEIELAEAVAAQAAIAIEQVLAHQQVKELAQRETTVNRITNAIRSSLETPVMFATIVKELGSALKVDGCTLSLWTKSDRFVKCVGLYNPHEPEQIVRDSPNWQQATTSNVPIAENPVLQALLYTRKPVCSADLEKQRNMARYELPLHSKARALLIVPLIVEAEIIGSITLRQNEASRNWSQAEIELAEAVAAQAAIAVQQAKLYHKVSELNNYLTESVLKRFLPAAIVNKAATGKLSLDLTPEPRRVTVLFCDLVGFTNLSSQLEVITLAEILNEYLEAMTKAVFDRGGTVDKFLGDGVMAMFGAPEHLSCPEQAKRAISTAKTMYYYLAKLNERWQDKNFLSKHRVPTLKMRCGIHQGKAVVGMFGGGQRKDYTAVGKVVNIASRLQSVATPNTILISENVANCLEQIDWGEGRNFKLKGLERDFRAFTIGNDISNCL